MKIKNGKYHKKKKSMKLIHYISRVFWLHGLFKNFLDNSWLFIFFSNFAVVTGLLIQARDGVEDEKGFDVLNSAPIITKLMPHILASISSLAASDPPCAVQVLSFIQEILPSVASLQNLFQMNSQDMDDNATSTDR